MHYEDINYALVYRAAIIGRHLPSKAETKLRTSWLWVGKIAIVISLHDGIKGGATEVQEAVAFGVEQMVAMADVQAE